MPEVIHDVGKLCLLWTDGTIEGEACAGLLAGEDPYDATNMAVYAPVFAGYYAGVLPASYGVVGWRSKDRYGVRAAEGTFASSYLGTHGSVAGAFDWKSLRGCLTGKTAFPTTTQPAGQTRLFVPLGTTKSPAPGARFFYAGTDAAWEALRAFLQGNGSLWGDFYGRKAIARDKVTYQFNAYVQQHAGS